MRILMKMTTDCQLYGIYKNMLFEYIRITNENKNYIQQQINNLEKKL